jgi:UDP-glucose 4-epimerase
VKFLIAGGAGAVGRDLTRALLKEGHAVRVLDTHTEGFPLSGQENLELIPGKVEDGALAARAVKDCDAIVHLAWSFADAPADLVAIDLAGQITLLAAAAAAKMPHFIYISSAIVYGSPTSVSISEDDPCLAEKARKPFYGVAKLAAEKFALAFWRTTGLPVTIFRFWWSYGEEIGGRHLRDMLSRAAAGQPLAVPEGAGGSFLHHDDLVQAILLALQRPKTYGEVFNLATVYLSWEDIAGIIIDLTGSASPLAVIPAPEWQGPQFLADSWRLCTCKAQHLLGYSSLLSFDSARQSLKDAIGRGLKKDCSGP